VLLGAALLATALTGGAAQAEPAGAQAAAAKASGAKAPGARGQAPGTLVSVAPSVFKPTPDAAADVLSWKIGYRSRDALGRPIVVSGTVLVPDDGAAGAAGPRPLISYAVGTVGMGDQCAPSAGFPTGTTAEGALIARLLDRGWAVVVTDYEGLGTPGTHTYTVGRSSGKAVLDAARAARRLPGIAGHGVTAASPVGLMGYSQGGQSVSWAAQLQPGYAPELEIAGTVTGGTPSRLRFSDGQQGAGYGVGFPLMSAIGMDAAYPGLRLDAYLNATGRALAERMAEGCLYENLAAGAEYTMADVTRADLADSRRWQLLLRRQDLGTPAPAHPVFVYHGEADDLIPPELGAELTAAWCARGATVQTLTLPGLDHLGAVPVGSQLGADWLSARFAGAPVTGDCPAS
jgi:pimeloyl-ACP methyl ester carboxylesterase